MAQKRGISPWMLILPVACLIGGVAAVYWSAPWRQPEPAAIPKATPIAQLGEGASAPAPLALPPVAPRAADRGDPHAQLAGLVIDGDLAPVSNVPLCVFGPTGIADATAISSTTGAYRFDSLLPGPCRLVVEATGYARTGLAGLNLLAGATLSDATVLLLPEAPIRGQVRANLSGEPLSGARITATLYAIDQKLIPLVAEFHQSITAIADASGYFVLAGLWPRVHYDLVAEASGFVRGRKTQVGSGTAGVDFVLSRGGAISGVALQAETGQPAPRAIISAHRLERSSYAVTADADGRFFLSGLPRGEYRLDAVWGDSFMLPHPDLERLQVEVGREVTGVTVELQKGGSLAGRVLDRRKESPVSGAVLELTSAWGRTQVESDAAGRFRFPALREGAYQLAVAAPAYAATRAFVRIAGGTEVQRDLYLSGGDAIAGFVRTRSGSPVQGARVQYGRARLDDARAAMMGFPEDYRAEAITSATGYFRHQPLEYGVYDLLVTATDYAPGRLSGIETGDEEVEITLSTGGGIAGSVTSVTGEPLPNARVTVGGAGGLLNDRQLRGGQTYTNAAGEYRVDYLEPGPYIVSVELPQRRRSAPERGDAGERREGDARPPQPGGDAAPAGAQRFMVPQAANLQLAPRTALGEGMALPLAQAASPLPGERRGGPGPAGAGGPLGSAEMRTRQLVVVKEGEVAVCHFGARDCVTLKGTVMKRNQPVPDVWIGLSEGEIADIGDVRRFGVAHTRTDAEGKFQLLGLAPGGRYFVHAARNLESVPVSEPVEMPQSGERTVTLKLPEGGVRGVVVDENGQPVRGAVVALEPASESAFQQPVEAEMGAGRRGRPAGATTDRQGVFQIDEVPPGAYLARAIYERRTAVAPLEVRGDRTAELRIALSPSGTLTGFISGMGLGEDSRVNALFILRDRDSGATLTQLGPRSLAGGEYKLENVTPGRYDVTCMVHLPDGVVAPSEETGVVIRAGEPTRRNFVLSPGVVVRLTMVDETGSPLRDAQVEVRDAYGNPTSRGVVVLTRAHNTWSAGFARRHYTLWIRKPGYRPAQVPLDLSESDATVWRHVVLVNDKVDLRTP